MKFNRAPMSRQNVENLIKQGAELTRHPTGDRLLPKWWRTNRQPLLRLFDSLDDGEALIDLRVVQEYDPMSSRPKREGTGVLLTSHRLGLLRSGAATWTAFDDGDPKPLKLMRWTDCTTEFTLADQKFVWYFEFKDAEGFARTIAPDRFAMSATLKSNASRPHQASAKALSTEDVGGMLLIIALGLAALFVAQRVSLPVFWRVVAGLIALVGVCGGVANLTEDSRARVKRAFNTLAVLGTLGVAIASATPAWSSVPTSGAPNRSVTTTPTDSYTPTDTYTPPDEPSEDPGTVPMHDPGNWNPAWIPCKEQLGLGSVSDYALTDGQEVQVMACVFNTNISSGQ